MSKWFAGGANRITLGRIPCMLVAAYAIFGPGTVSLAWFWLGATALTIGMVLDWLDGYWARNIAPNGPTLEGQYLDQFVDKWGFVYPLLAMLAAANEFAWPVYVLLAFMTALDIRSNIGHYRNYRHSLQHGFNKSFGAVWPGKVKFGLQNGIVCVLVALRCPYQDGLALPAWADWPSWFVTWAASYLQHLVPVAFITAIVLASLSLFKRKKISAKALQDAAGRSTAHAISA